MNFQTPSGIVCPGRKDTKPLPTPHKAFKFTAEILKPVEKTINFIRVILSLFFPLSNLL